ncbi:MAG: amidohydrolase family protein [Chloroflexota bacterium]|nr:amidohydrolase family protein [Chloroflexota bacterium]
MTVAVRASTLIDGVNDEPLLDAVILIDDGRITEVGAASVVSVPSDAETLDFAGLTIAPGLIDCHVHLVFSAGTDPLGDVLAEDDFAILLRAGANARQALRAGVTTVRDLGGRSGVTLALRDAVNRGLVAGARVMAHGSPITLTGGHCHFLGLEADTEDDVRLAVRSQVKQGVDGIKIMSTGGRMTPRTNPAWAQYSLAQISAAVEETRRAGLTIAAHGHGTAGIRNAVQARVDTIEHCTWLTERDGTEVAELDEETARAMVRNGTRVVPTLMPGKMASLVDPAMLTEASRRNAALRPTVIAIQRQMLEMGVRFAAGTDSGVVRTPADPVVRRQRVPGVGQQRTRGECGFRQHRP